MKLVSILVLLLSLSMLTERTTATPPAQWRDVSVLDYVAPGATPDGSDLVEALADAPRVFVPTGTNLVITDEITIPTGKTLTIDGTLTAAPSRPANWRMLRVHASNDITITGRGSLLSGTQSNNIYGIWVSGSSKRIQISDLTISGFYGGVWSPADGSWRDDNRLDRVTVSGGYIGLSLTSWRNARITSPSVSNFTYIGIGTYNAAGIQIQGGTVSNGGYVSSASAGISVELAPDSLVENVTIQNIEGHGIRVSNKSHRAVISGNRISTIGWLNGVITHGASSGVAAWVGPTDGESFDLSIRNNVLRTIAGYGIIAHPGLTVSITDNNLDGIGDPGISVLAAEAIVTGNRVNNVDGYGISLGPDPDGGPYQVSLAIVSNNLITNSGLDGIMANGSPADGVISGNVLSGNDAGITVQNWVWGNQTFVPDPILADNVLIP